MCGGMALKGLWPAASQTVDGENIKFKTLNTAVTAIRHSCRAYLTCSHLLGVSSELLQQAVSVTSIQCFS